jgi:hypothetical protein
MLAKSVFDIGSIPSIHNRTGDKLKHSSWHRRLIVQLWTIWSQCGKHLGLYQTAIFFKMRRLAGWDSVGVSIVTTTDDCSRRALGRTSLRRTSVV